MSKWNIINYNLLSDSGDQDDLNLYDYLEYRWSSNCIDWDEDCESGAEYLARKYSTATVTRAWKVYGMDGHRQRESFSPSYSLDPWTGNHVDIINADITGTNDYTIIVITAADNRACQDELDGQISDGIFENSRTGTIIEIVSDEMMAEFNAIPKDTLRDIAFMLGSTEECEMFLDTILRRHGYKGHGFWGLNPEEDIALTLDIYNTLFVNGGMTPFQF